MSFKLVEISVDFFEGPCGTERRSGQHTFLRFSDLHVAIFSHIRSFSHLDLVSNGVALVLLGAAGALGSGHVGHVAEFQ